VTHTNNLCVSGSYKKLFEFHRQDKISGPRIFLLNFEAGKFGRSRYFVNLANSLECPTTSQKSKLEAGSDDLSWKQVLNKKCSR